MVTNKKSIREDKKEKKAEKKRTRHQPGKGSGEAAGTGQMTEKQTSEEKAGISSENGNGTELTEKGVEEFLTEKIRELEERYLRLAAEFDNYRKRTLKEKADLTKLAGADILTDLLPVIDDFDRAVDAMQNANEAGAMKKGIELIYGKLKDFMRQKGVMEIHAVGTEFDTDLHEAVTKIPVASKKDSGKVVDVIEKGYLLHDRVIRYAKVVVGA